MGGTAYDGNTPALAVETALSGEQYMIFLLVF